MAPLNLTKAEILQLHFLAWCLFDDEGMKATFGAAHPSRLPRLLSSSSPAMINLSRLNKGSLVMLNVNDALGSAWGASFEFPATCSAVPGGKIPDSAGC